MANDKIYCDKCGAENEVGSGFCKKCGADLHGTSAEKPSNVWYLLPILLGIIGGIIGYIVIKAKDERMARNMLYVGLGTFVLGIIIIAAMSSPSPEVDTGVPISPPTPAAVTPAVTQTPRPTPIVTPAPTPVLTYQDSEYSDWVIDTSYSITLDLNLMTSAAERSDFEGFETYSGMLYDDAKKALDEIDQFDVTPALKPSKDEVKLALQDYKQAGYYGEKGARNYDTNDIETSTDYLERGARHFFRADDLLE